MKDMDGVINLLEMTLATMDKISVKGLDNLDMFLGCGQAIRNVLKILKQPAGQPEDTEREETAEASDG